MMYTNIKGVQILISLLKQFNIRYIVISPGTRNTALVHSVEMDDFFSCYSIVDERSAGFFALGIAKELDVPVCMTCTAATATCNYLPAMKEAYECNSQLVALTADQDPYEMFQMEDQCINQVDMFHGFVKCAVDVPKVMNQNDEWYFNRCVNEALLELNHHGKGPVQINYHMSYSLDELSTFEVEVLPKARKIDRFEDITDWSLFSKELAGKKKILVVCGSDYNPDQLLRAELKTFTEKFNCAVLYDTFSNVGQADAKEIMCPNALGDIISLKDKAALCPELILSFGNVYYSTIKYFLLGCTKEATHWQIAVDGKPNDGYHCLTKLFECKPETFLAGVNDCMHGINEGSYVALWHKYLAKLQYPDLGFTHFKVIKEFCKLIPAHSILHCSVLDSIRISNYVPMNPSVRCFANIGADGIDGALSAFLGQAEGDNQLAFLLIGDLSLMYDMNALLRNMPKNVRILVINNYAGAEFYKNFGLERIPTLNEYIAAGHKIKMERLCLLSNMKYIQANDLDSLHTAFDCFIHSSEVPILMEVFTDAHKDAETLKAYWKINQNAASNCGIGHKAKTMLKKALGKKKLRKAKQILYIIKNKN